MKVKLGSFSRRALGKYRPGSVVEMPEAEALNLLNLGYAVAVVEDGDEKASSPDAAPVRHKHKKKKRK